MTYGVSSSGGQGDRRSPSGSNCGKSSWSKMGEGAQLARDLEMELDRPRDGGWDSLGFMEEELVKDKVDTMEPL